jgi:putative peptidoglycan lipid II flippase
LVALAGIGFIAFAAHPLVGIVGAGFLPSKSSLTIHLLYLLLPVILLQSVSNFWGSLLNANGRFALAASTPIITSVIATFAVLHLSEKWGISVLAGATLGGLTLEATVIATTVQRTFGSLMPRWHGYDRDTRTVMAQYLPVVAGSFVTSIIVLVDQAVAARLGPGSIAAINYGNKLVTVVLTLMAVAVGTAVLPYFSRFVVVRDWYGARACLRRWIAIMFFLSLIVMAIFLWRISLDVIHYNFLFSSATFFASE